jgi:hypothetical protein
MEAALAVEVEVARVAAETAVEMAAETVVEMAAETTVAANAYVGRECGVRGCGVRGCGVRGCEERANGGGRSHRTVPLRDMFRATTRANARENKKSTVGERCRSGDTLRERNSLGAQAAFDGHRHTKRSHCTQNQARHLGTDFPIRLQSDNRCCRSYQPTRQGRTRGR